MEYIKGLHEGWSEEVMAVLDATPPDSVEQRDLYDRRPEFFRSWADGNVVLIGDAVHAVCWIFLPALVLTVVRISR